MRKLQYEIVCLLWCCVIGSAMDVELDQRTESTDDDYDEFSPENLILKKGEYISLPHGFKPPSDLTLYNCKGTIDKTTFSKLPDLRHIYFDECNIDHLYPNAFSTLKKLEGIVFGNSVVHFEKSSEVDNTENTPLESFKDLSFEMSTVSDLNRKALYDLSALNELIIDNTEVTSIDSDSFDDLKKITHLAIKTTKIPDLDAKKIAKLHTLKYLGLLDLETEAEIEYSVFKDLPSLEIILFDTLAYRHLDFDDFPKLKTIEIGLGETRESEKLRDNALYHEIRDRIDALKTKGIENRVVRAGKNHVFKLDRIQ